MPVWIDEGGVHPPSYEHLLELARAQALERLRAGGSAMQCQAVWTEGKDSGPSLPARRDGFFSFLARRRA